MNKRARKSVESPFLDVCNTHTHTMLGAGEELEWWKILCSWEATWELSLSHQTPEKGGRVALQEGGAHQRRKVRACCSAASSFLLTTPLPMGTIFPNSVSWKEVHLESYQDPRHQPRTLSACRKQGVRAENPSAQSSLDGQRQEFSSLVGTVGRLAR